jgi:HTH-type transcriptional regulator/antitoxin HigA
MTTALKIPASYSRLTRQFPLRPIRSAVQYREASVILDKLAVRDESSLDAGEADYLETLSLLIEAYDREHYASPLHDAAPLDVLKFLMEENGIKQSELSEILGIGPSAASMIVSGQRPITADHARRLGKRFSVDPGLFI